MLSKTTGLQKWVKTSVGEDAQQGKPHAVLLGQPYHAVVLENSLVITQNFNIE